MSWSGELIGTTALKVDYGCSNSCSTCEDLPLAFRRGEMHSFPKLLLSTQNSFKILMKDEVYVH